MVEVVVLDRLRHSKGDELVANLGKTRCELPQLVDLGGIERQFALKEVVEARGEGRHSQIRDTVREMVERVRDLAPLEFSVGRQCGEPRLRRVTEHAHRRARIGEQQPRTRLIVGEHLSDPIRPAREQARREPRLECLHRSTRLEPSDTVGERHPQHR